MKLRDIQTALRHWESLKSTRQNELGWMRTLVEVTKSHTDIDAAAERILTRIGKPNYTQQDWNLAHAIALAALDIDDGECPCGDGR